MKKIASCQKSFLVSLSIRKNAKKPIKKNVNKYANMLLKSEVTADDCADFLKTKSRMIIAVENNKPLKTPIVPRHLLIVNPVNVSPTVKNSHQRDIKGRIM